ncbi:MAG: hypothetical protein EZS28_050286, partial [Streblomastix strix]
LPLPEDVNKEVLQYLKYHDDYNEIEYLAECPENHNVILSDSFEKELFKEFDEYHTLQYLRLTILLLQLGSNINKKKVALSVKDKVIRLTIEEYVDQLDDENNWDEDEIQEIKCKSRQAVQLIKSIEEEIEQEGEFEEINGIQFHSNEDIEVNQDNQYEEIEQEEDDDDEQQEQQQGQEQNQQDLNNIQEIEDEQNSNYDEEKGGNENDFEQKFE